MRRLPSQCLTEKTRVVGDDAVDSEVTEAAHVRGIVDGPDQDLLCGAFELADQFGICQLAAWDHVLSRELAPTPKFGLRFADQA